MIASRREFLVGGLRTAAAVPLLSWIGPARSAGERVLVVLQLTGGNDGLNTVVPHRQDAYYRLRPTLAHKPGALHALDDDHGLHPAMGALGELYAKGLVTVVHGVGYPHPDRSHFRSMEIWHTADPVNPPDGVGWMGRLADQVVASRAGTMAALHVGTGNLPLALYGRDSFAPTVHDAEGFRLRGPAALARWRAAVLDLEPAAGQRPELAFLRTAARQTYRAAERMEDALDRGPSGEYPATDLARQLRLIARLIAGGFDTRLFHVELSGFDTHARQAATHAGLLGTLSDALGAFQRDLAANGVEDRVVTLVFSEFGRRVAENGSRGTDHGAGAPAFVVGRAVGGGVYGTPPDLGRLEEGDVPYSTDFRSLYTTLERDWLGLRPSTAVEGLAFLGA